MRPFIIALIACFASFSAYAYAAPNIGIQNARTLVTADMARPPLTAVAFTQCNLLIAAFFTLQNGQFAKIDVAHHQGIDYNEALRWGDTATSGAVRVEATCDEHVIKTAGETSAPAMLADLDLGAVVRLHICGEVAALVVGTPTGLTILLLKDRTSDYVKNVLDSVQAAKNAGASVADVELQDGCART